MKVNLHHGAVLTTFIRSVEGSIECAVVQLACASSESLCVHTELDVEPFFGDGRHRSNILGILLEVEKQSENLMVKRLFIMVEESNESGLSA